MSKEILLTMEAVANEKLISKESVFEAMEYSLASATRKKHAKDQALDMDVRVAIDRKTGEYDAFRRWEVVADDYVQDAPTRQISLSAAQLDQPEINLGEWVEEPIEAATFGRIAIQTAKQTIFQKIREAERRRIIEEYRGRVGQLLTGIVKRTDRHGLFIDLGKNAEAFVPRSHMIAREAVRVGDRIRGYLLEVNEEARDQQLIVSRTSPQFLIELFKVEVPEVGQGTIEIMGAARDPGSRAKISVRTHDPRIDPVGACVGMRGSRVQTVSNELGGERIDIVLWHEEEAKYIIEAMSPAEISSIVIDEENHSMDIAVEADKFAIAIGRNGQNVRLGSELTGWKIQVMNVDEIKEKSEKKAAQYIELFKEQLDVDEEVAMILAQEEFTSIEEIAGVAIEELLAIDEFDENIVNELRSRASDFMLTKAIASEAKLSDNQDCSQALMAIEGMDEQTAIKLVENDILSVSDLADQAVYEIVELDGIDMEEEQAGKLIMAARQLQAASEQENPSSTPDQAEAL